MLLVCRSSAVTSCFSVEIWAREAAVGDCFSYGSHGVFLGVDFGLHSSILEGCYLLGAGQPNISLAACVGGRVVHFAGTAVVSTYARYCRGKLL